MWKIERIKSTKGLFFCGIYLSINGDKIIP